MSISQSISIIVAVVVSAVIIGLSVNSQKPNSILGSFKSDNDNTEEKNEPKFFTIKSVIEKISSNSPMHGTVAGQTKTN